jgi:putative membrane protein
MMHGFGMGLGFFGFVLMLLFWIGLVLLSVWLVKSLFQGTDHPRSHKTGRENTAKEILKHRYARGEISREQFELMSRDLE